VALFLLCQEVADGPAEHCVAGDEVPEVIGDAEPLPDLQDVGRGREVGHGFDLVIPRLDSLFRQCKT
jgi:hypothetical protein